MKTLLTLGPKELSSGLYSGVGKAAALLWTQGENIAFRDMGVRRIDGVQPLFYLGGEVKALDQYYGGGQRRVYVGSETGLFQWSGAGVETVWTWASAAGSVDLETWGSWLLGTNDLDPVVVWKGGPSGVPLAGTNFTRAKLLFRQGPHMMALNTNVGDNVVHWSHDDDVEQWLPSATNTAGDLTLRDLDSEIIAVAALGNRAAVYSRASLVVLSYIGPPGIFGASPTLVGPGAISAKSIVSQGPYNYGLGQNGIFKTDGNSFGYLDDPGMSRWLRDTVDWNQPEEIWGMHDDVLRQVKWSFLDKDGARRGVAFHYDLNVFTREALDTVAGAERKAFQFPLVADSTGSVGLWQGQGGQIEWNLQSKPLDFGSREVLKILQMVRVDGTWDPGVRLRLGVVDQPEDPVEWFWDQPLREKNYPDREGAYFVLQFVGSGPASVTGIEFLGNVGGLAL